jgi:biopolymer transport protein TolR
MAGGVMNGSNGRRQYGTASRFRPMSEINVTPLVDVMLVLLIVFMITAPLLTVGVPVDLPQTKAEAIADPQEPIVLTLQKDGHIYLQETPVDFETLVAKLQAITENKPDTTIFVKGDKTVAYGEVMKLMGEVTTAGFSKVSLIVEMPRDSSPAETTTGSAAPAPAAATTDAAPGSD